MIPTLLAFLDVVLSFVAWLLIAVAFSQPKVAAQDRDHSPGQIVAEISWLPGNDDVDLWVQAPGDPPVGYSNKGSAHCNLLRDDLGHPDPERNDEVIYCRGAAAGTYTVNVHGYRVSAPLTVRVTVRSTLTDRTIWTGPVDLAPREERTAVRFALDASGGLVPGSVSHLPAPIVYGGRQ